MSWYEFKTVADLKGPTQKTVRDDAAGTGWRTREDLVDERRTKQREAQERER